MPRAILTKSAPKPSAIAILSGVTNLPDAANFTLSRIPYFSNMPDTIGRAVNSGKPTPSCNSWNVAPVPPSPPSIVIKLGYLSNSTIVRTSVSISETLLTTILNPTGF
ncbi:Uncharacterised protein [Staphylococcus aureus]|nr:Uncharacterised protein [Staphylococcus aureus]